MTRLTTQRSKPRRRPHRLLEAGTLAFVAGVLLLFVPALGGTLQPVGSLVLLVGVVLLILHLLGSRLVDTRRASQPRSDSAFSTNGYVHSWATDSTRPFDDR